MAIFYLQCNVSRRSKGHNAIAAAAYRRGIAMKDKLTNTRYNYSNKEEIVFSGFAIPENAPEWLLKYKEGFDKEDRKTIEAYWNYYESCEKRKDAQLTRDFIVALPKELTTEQQIKLLQEFVQDQLAQRGMVVDYSLHHDAGNPHAHIAASMRSVDAEGFGEKVRAWNDKSFLHTIRQSFTEYTNFHLKLAGHDVRIDHRTYEEQGIDLMPSFHVGRAAYDLEKRGIPSTLVAKAEAIREENLKRISRNPTLVYDKLMTQRETFTAEHVLDEVSRYTRSAVPNFDETSRATVLSEEKIKKILENIEEHESVFTNQDIAKALFEHIHKEDAKVFMNALLELKASPHLIYLGAGDDGQDCYTTRRMFKLESGIQHQVDLLKNAKHFNITQDLVSAYIKEYETLKGKPLLPEQLDAVLYAVSDRQIACVVGRAGTGKSFSLGAANAVWEKAGFEVYGVALSGVAADGLNKDAGMNSSTIESFKYKIKDGKIVLKKRSVVVMDEAGMTDSISMAFVIDAVQQAEAKLVLVGDHAQLQPVGPGAVFRAIVERMVFKELLTVFRQREQWQKDATVNFAKGFVAEAIGAYAEKGCVHYLDKKELAMAALASSWKETYTAGTPIKEMIVLSYTREDVKALNQNIRSIRVTAGDLYDSKTVQSTRGKIDLAAGDRLLFLKNNNKYGVKNGRFATVDGFEEVEGRIFLLATLDGDDAKKVVIDTSDYQDFDYGYAATVHKTQGATVDRAFLYISRGWDRCLAYVGMSRHRDRCDVFTDLNAAGLVQEVQKYSLKDSLFDFAYHFALRRGFDEDSLAGRLKDHLGQRLSQLKEVVINQHNDLNKRHWDEVYERIKNNAEFNTTFNRREKARVVAAYVNSGREIGKVYQQLNERMVEFNIPKMDHQDPRILILKETAEYKNFEAYIKHRDALAYQINQDLSDLSLALEKSNIDVTKIKASAKRHECREKVKTYLDETATGRVLMRDKLAMHMAMDIKSYYPLLLEAGVDTSHFYNQARTHERRIFAKDLNTVERTRLKEVERYLALEQETIRLYVKHNPKEATEKNYSFTKEPHYYKVARERDSLAFKILNHIEEYSPQLDFYEIGIARPQFGSLERPKDTAIEKATQRWIKIEKQGRSHQLRFVMSNWLEAKKDQNEVLAQQLAAELVKDKKAAFREFAEEFGAGNKLWQNIHQDARAFAALNFSKGLTSPEDRALFKEVSAFNDVRAESGRAWAEAVDGMVAPIDFKAVTGLFADAAQQLSRKKSELARGLLNSYKADSPVYAYFGLDFTKLKNDAGFKKLDDEAIQMVTNYQELCQSKDKKKGDYVRQMELARQILEDKDILKGAITGLKVNWQGLFNDSKNAFRHHLLNDVVPGYKEEARTLLKYDAISKEVGKLYSELSVYKSQNKKSRSKLEINIKILTGKRDQLASQITANANDSLALMVMKQDKVAKIAGYAKNHDIRVLQVEEYAQKRKHYLQSLQNCVKQGKYNVDFIYVQDELKELIQPLEKNLKLYQFALRAKGLSVEQLQKDKAIFKTYEELAYLQAGFGTASTPSAITPDDQAKIKRVQNILKATTPIEGTLAERYLREYRGIEGALPPSCRFHPGMKHFETGQKYPALVVTAQNIDKSIGKPTAQVIYLDPATGNKAPLEAAKLTYGRFVEGTAVMINKGKDPARIAIVEGPETALSIKEANPDLTIYAVLGSGNFKKIPLSEQVKEIIFCADNDYKIDPAEQKGIPASEKKIMEAAEYFAEKGIDVYRVMPKNAKEDFNDVLKKEGVEKVREYLAQPEKIAEGVRVDRLEAKVKEYLGQPAAPKESIRLEGNEIILTTELTEMLEDYLAAEDTYDAAAKLYFKNLSKPEVALFEAEKNKAAEPLKEQLEKLLKHPDYLEVVKLKEYKFKINEDENAKVAEARLTIKEKGRVSAEHAYNISSKINSSARILKVVETQSRGMSQSI